MTIAAGGPTRREALAGALAAATIAAAPRTASAAGETRVGLKDHAGAKGIAYGCAMRGVDVPARRGWGEALRREAAIVTPEYEMKWDALSKAPHQYDFGPADAVVAFAEGGGQAIRGHTLVWSRALPAWFPTAPDAREAERLMRDHIATVAGRYSGRVVAWDVVNEPVGPGGLEPSPWLAALGPAYVATALRAAAESAPGAKLYVNDYDLEYDTPDQDARRRNMLDLLTRLRDEGVPLHGLGVQGHLQPGRWPYRPEKFAAFLDSVAALDLEIAVTEMDVADRYLPGPVAERDAAIGDAVGTVLRTALDQPRVTTVMTWGLADWRSWLNEYPDRRRADGLPQRPLPLDANGDRKPFWQAMAGAFDDAAPRGR